MTCQRIEEEQATKAQNWKLPVCYDDDDDEERSNSLEDNIIFGLPPCSAITPNEPVDSLSMRNEHLSTIPATESDEFNKSCVENLVPNPSESEGENGCDVPAYFTTFSNILFDAEYEFDSSDDQSLSDEDFSKEIFSKFEEEIISTKIDPHHFNAKFDLIESMLKRDSSIISSSSKIDSLLDEFTGELTLLKSILSGIDETDCYPEEHIRLIERLLYDNSSPCPPKEFVSDNSDADIESFSPSPIPVEYKLPSNYSLSLPVNESFHFDIPSFSRPPAKPPDGNTGILNIKMMGDNSKKKVPVRKLMVTLASNQEKSPDLLSHRGLENFQLSAKCPMTICGKNTPIMDVPLFHFYPLDQFKYGGNWVKLNDLKQALRGRHPMLIIVQYSWKFKDSCQMILSSKSSFPQLQLGIILLHLAGSQPMLKSLYKADDGVIISISPLVGGVADVVVEIKGWSISITFRFSVGFQTPDDLIRSRLGFIDKMGVHG
nr:hypothetical protein [Tanacetum cinerariifolium]